MYKGIKILQVSTADLGGGAEKSALFLFGKYRELGHKSWLAVGRKLSTDTDIFEIPKPAARNTPSYNLDSLGDRVLKKIDTIIPTKKGIKFYLNDLATGASEIKQILRYESGMEDFHHPGSWRLPELPPEQPDIIHLHNLHGYYFDLRYLPKLSHQYPVILNLRDMWTLTGHCALPINCSRWMIGCGHCPDLNIYPAIARDATKYNFRIKKNIFLQSKLFITTPSKWLMDQVLSSGMFSALEYRVIPNAINVQVFKPGSMKLARQTLELPQDARIIIFLSHSMFKDFETMRAALHHMRKGQTPLIFLCIGLEGEKELIGEGELIFTGRIMDENTMILYYQAADVYIHAAHHEVFGKSIVESMACATPVVATAIDGISEVVQDGVTGFLTPPKDPLSLAERVNSLLDDPDLRREIGMNSANQARRTFNLGRQADDFLSWYQEILENKGLAKNEVPSTL